MPILKNIAANIQHLEVKKWKWNLSPNILMEVLKKCHNLRSIKFVKIHFHYPEKLTEILQFQNQLDLEVIESDSRIFKLFRHTKVHRLVYDYVPTDGHFSIPDVIRFLSVQDQLTDLTMTGFLAFFYAGIGHVIFNDTQLSNLKFRLKKLTIRNSSIRPTIHFHQFLQLHVDSLESLEIDDTQYWDFVDFVSSCKSLKELKIGKRKKEIKLDQLRFMPTVQRLTIDGPIGKNVLEKFPGLEKLEVSRLKVVRDKFNEDLGLVELKELTLERTWLGGFFKLPKLKKLKLRNIRVMKYEVFEENPQIEEVILENCDQLEVNEAEIRKRLRNLRNFIVIIQKVEKISKETPPLSGRQGSAYDELALRFPFRGNSTV